VSSFRTVASRDAGEELTGKYLQRVLKELTAPWSRRLTCRDVIHGVSLEVIPDLARAPKLIDSQGIKAAPASPTCLSSCR